MKKEYTNNIEQKNKLLEVEREVKTDIYNGIDPNFPPLEDDNNAPFGGDKSKPFFSPKQGKDGEKKNTDTPNLDTFGIDLTGRATEGELDPMIGRAKELERLIQILCRRKKNNPILLGDPGVGKSAIVEGLAQRIVEKKVPPILFNKRIISLDTGSLVSGTKYRGQFEERIKAILKELKENPNILLFIDEIHTIIGAGSAEGSADMANMLKPALARGEVRCIGATTLNEYSKSIEKDGAMERRFQKVMVEATSPEETLEILEQIKEQYQQYHKVKYTEEALIATVELTNRYISDRFFPDKAIDVIDEAGARMHIKHMPENKELKSLKIQREELLEKRSQAVLNNNFELAASWRNQQRIVDQKINELENELAQSYTYTEVNADHIASVVALMTGVPAERIAKAETERLRSLRNNLEKIVIGQNEAIEKVSRAIQRNRLGLRNEKRPIGSFLFLGSTGVGKTFLAKKLAEQLFGDEDALIRVDMSEFSEKFTVSRLVGAPPGYVGYEEGGQLTEKVRRHPYSVVLLDEIEKAHPEVFNMLLTILDEGSISDSFGRKIDFKNTVIIMTGNIGSRKVNEYKGGLGFQFNEDNQVERVNQMAKEVIDKELKNTFSPEFINRLDAIIHFAHLKKENLLAIVENELKVIQERFNRQEYSFEITAEAREWLAEKGFDPLYGVRPLKRLLQKEIEDRFTDLFLEGNLDSGTHVYFSLGEDKLIASLKKPTAKRKKKEEAELQLK